VEIRRASRRCDPPVCASFFFGQAAVRAQAGTLSRVFQQPVMDSRAGGAASRRMRSRERPRREHGHGQAVATGRKCRMSGRRRTTGFAPGMQADTRIVRNWRNRGRDSLRIQVEPGGGGGANAVTPGSSERRPRRLSFRFAAVAAALRKGTRGQDALPSLPRIRMIGDSVVQHPRTGPQRPLRDILPDPCSGNLSDGLTIAVRRGNMAANWRQEAGRCTRRSRVRAQPDRLDANRLPPHFVPRSPRRRKAGSNE